MTITISRHIGPIAISHADGGFISTFLTDALRSRDSAYDSVTVDLSGISVLTSSFLGAALLPCYELLVDASDAEAARALIFIDGTNDQMASIAVARDFARQYTTDLNFRTFHDAARFDHEN